jgi:hypothetical protein
MSETENRGERSFAEVLSLDKVPLTTSPAKKVEPLLASRCDSELPEMPASKEQLMLKGPMDSDIVFIRGDDVGVEESLRNVTAHFGESFKVNYVGNTLLCIKRDVVWCLKWMDFGLCPCACGLLGHVP